jgi:hypothetical protein
MAGHRRGRRRRRGPCRRLRLAPEPPDELGIARQFRVDDLHRDRPAAGRAAQVDPAHPARAQSGLQPVNPHLPRIVRCQRFHRAPRTVSLHPCAAWQLRSLTLAAPTRMSAVLADSDDKQ